MTLWLHLKADKVSHPYRPQGYPSYRQVHIGQVYLPRRLQILRLLCLGGTSSHCGEVEVVFFKERRIASRLMGSSNSIFKRSSRRRIVILIEPSDKIVYNTGIRRERDFSWI